YAWAYLFGAVCPERAVGAALVLPYADTEATGLHLAEIGRRVAPGAHAVVVLDGAGWHASGGLAVPENLTLLPLPSYSPDLNPVAPGPLEGVPERARVGAQVLQHAGHELLARARAVGGRGRGQLPRPDRQVLRHVLGRGLDEEQDAAAALGHEAPRLGQHGPH